MIWRKLRWISDHEVMVPTLFGGWRRVIDKTPAGWGHEWVDESGYLPLGWFDSDLTQALYARRAFRKVDEAKAAQAGAVSEAA